LFTGIHTISITVTEQPHAQGLIAFEVLPASEVCEERLRREEEDDDEDEDEDEELGVGGGRSSRRRSACAGKGKPRS